MNCGRAESGKNRYAAESRHASLNSNSEEFAEQGLFDSGRTARIDRRHAESLRRPSHVEADDIAFIDHLNSRHRAANPGTDYRDEGEFEEDFLAAMRADDAAPARAIELEDHPLIEIAGKAFAVVFIGHMYRVALRGHALKRVAE